MKPCKALSSVGYFHFQRAWHAAALLLLSSHLMDNPNKKSVAPYNR